MLKTAVPSERLTFVEVNDGEGDDSIDGVEIAKKLGKPKGQKTSKSQKLAKSKKPSKRGNSPNFNVKNSRPGFLTPKAKAAFNRLQ